MRWEENRCALLNPQSILSNCISRNHQTKHLFRICPSHTACTGKTVASSAFQTFKLWVTDTFCIVGTKSFICHLPSSVATVMLILSEDHIRSYLIWTIIWRSIWVRPESIRIHPTRYFLYSRPVLLLPGCLIHAALGGTLEEDANMLVHCYSISLLVLCFQFTMSFQIPKVQSRYYLWVLWLGFMAPIFSFKSGVDFLS